MKKNIQNYILWVLVLTSAILIIIYWKPLIDLFSNQGKISNWIKSFGLFGPLIFVSLQALQVVITPLPGVALSAIAGLLFGLFWGSLYSLAGIVIGSTVIFYLTRRLGRNFIEKHTDKNLLKKFDHLSEKGGPVLFFILFLLPFPPDDLVCFLAGLTSIPISYLMIILVLGRLPLVILTTASLTFQSLGWPVWLVLISVFAFLALILYIKSERIIEILEKKK